MPPYNQSYIGAVGNPALANLRLQRLALPGAAEEVRGFQSDIEGAYRPGPTVLPQIISGATEAMQGGLSPAERLAGQRRILGQYRSAVGGTAGLGARMGQFSPRAAQRVAVREAGQRLAPAFGQLEAAHGRRRLQGLQTGLGALGGVFGQQAAAEERARQAFGEQLGSVLKGSAGGLRRPVGARTLRMPSRNPYMMFGGG